VRLKCFLMNQEFLWSKTNSVLSMLIFHLSHWRYRVIV